LSREKPIQAGDFMRIGLKGAWVNRLVEPNELLISLLGCGELFHLLKIFAGRSRNTNLLGNFAVHGGIIIFLGIHMATDTRSPTSGLSILREGSFLKKETTVWMKDPKMYGSMK
jgi:hypothetical protein